MIYVAFWGKTGNKKRKQGAVIYFNGNQLIAF
jgi:hypothetical protein